MKRFKLPQCIYFPAIKIMWPSCSLQLLLSSSFVPPKGFHAFLYIWSCCLYLGASCAYRWAVLFCSCITIRCLNHSFLLHNFISSLVSIVSGFSSPLWQKPHGTAHRDPLQIKLMIFLIGANTLCIFICDRYASLNFEELNPCSFSLNLLLLMENGKLLSSLDFAAVNIFIVRLSE